MMNCIENKKLSSKVDEYKKLDEKIAKIEDLLKSAGSTSKKKSIDNFI